MYNEIDIEHFFIITLNYKMMARFNINLLINLIYLNENYNLQYHYDKSQ
jgi:hypothetical protein